MTPIGDLSAPAFDGARLSHAYIACGNPADKLALAVVCSAQGMKPCLSCVHCEKAQRGRHPDISFVEKRKDKQEIAVEQIRELKENVIVVPNEAEKKAYVICSADTMSIAAQNAFLQILEEPPAHAVFVLKTESPALLLPTVRSRCVEVKTKPDTKSPEPAAEDLAKDFFDAIEGGNIQLIRIMFRLEKLDKNEFADFLAAARRQAVAGIKAGAPGSMGPSRELYSKAEKLLLKAAEFMDRYVNVGHISGMLCASLIGEKEKRNSIDRSN